MLRHQTVNPIKSFTKSLRIVMSCFAGFLHLAECGTMALGGNPGICEKTFFFLIIKTMSC